MRQWWLANSHQECKYYRTNGPCSYHAQIYVKRIPIKVLFDLLLVIFVVDLLSLTAYGIPLYDLSDRLQMNVTMLLTAIAFKQFASESMPNVPYL